MTDARGYLYILRNRNFLLLWLAQIQSLLALNSLLFVTIILFEKVTQSSIQTAGVIAAFSLPAVFFAPVAGLILDRIPKKTILVVSNALRVVTQVIIAILAALALENRLGAGLALTSVYIMIFVSSAVGQFFAPAEGATIPLLVGREGLFAANSLFTLTVVATQVLALVAFVPLAIKLLGVINAYLLLAVFYGGATLLLMLLPRDPVAPRGGLDARSMSRKAWQEIGEGWRFSIRHRPILIGILQFSLVGVLVFVMATLAPGYAARVLGLTAEDSIFVFSPAGVGMLLASVLVVRYGPRFQRHTLPITGMILMGISLLGLGLVGRYSTNKIFAFSGISVDATTPVGLSSFLAGIALALILIPAQTAVQEEASDEIRGRVLTVQFTLANALAVLPLLTFGGLADVYGIPNVTIGLGLALLLIALANFLYARQLTPSSGQHFVAEAFPLAGADASTVRSEDDADVRYNLREQPAPGNLPGDAA